MKGDINYSDLIIPRRLGGKVASIYFRPRFVHVGHLGSSWPRFTVCTMLV